ncbi:MAG: polyprenyl synthetase family protein [Candidatus Thermoplasmatota archaeon]|nr:polyprenyl synthetase family protein [Candidatus Thermoplasmatota archaeon]
MNLQDELTQRATQFNDYWQQYLKKGTPEVLYDAARHLPLAGGKRIRPFLAMMACESASGDAAPVMPFAAGLELMHNFTLVHDDIMDHSLIRRNLPTVHKKYGVPAAILSGDLLFAKSFQAVLDVSVDFPTFKKLEHAFVNCIIAICEGQQLDIDFEQRKRVTEQEYLAMIGKKTGALFELAAQGGGLIGGGSPQEVAALTTYGAILGLAFQIWDDYLDMSSDAATLGKDIGNDIRNGKKTLIAVHSFAHANGKHKKVLDDIFGNRAATDHEVQKVYDLFVELGSVEYARQRAVSYTHEAKDAIAVLKDTPAKKLLHHLIDYTIQREK